MGEARKHHRGAAMGAAVVMAAIGLTVLVPGLASAQELDAIDTITIIGDPEVPLRNYDRFRVEATWSLPDTPDPRAGDTFTLRFPQPELAGWSSSFDLLAADNVSVVGHCEVVTEQISCELGPYVESHSGIGGTLWFEAQAQAETDEEQYTLTTGHGVEVPLVLPGGGGVGPRNETEPTTLTKWGWVTQDGSSFVWRIFVPASALAPAQDLTPAVLIDTLDPALTRENVQVGLIDNWNNGDFWDTLVWLEPITGYIRSDEGQEMSISVLQPATSGLYLLQYTTPVPPEAEPGDSYRNEVSLNGIKPVERWVETADAGGSANGSTKRSIALTKSVVGPAPAEYAFAFTISCLRNGTPVAGYPLSAVLKATDNVVFGRIPVGSVCEITETDGGGGAVSFQPAGPITIGADSPEVVEVTALNTFVAPTTSLVPTVVPSTTTSSPPVVVVSSTSQVASPSAVPSVQPTAARGSLAKTGVTVFPLLGLSVTLIVGGCALVLWRTRTARSGQYR